MEKKKITVQTYVKLCTSGIFLLFIFSLTILNLFTPHKTFSENENRMLADFPDASLNNIFLGDFDTQFEDWFSDQFIRRAHWIEMKAALRKDMGAIENNNVFFGKDDRLIQQFLTYDETVLKNNINAINEFSEDNGVVVNVLLVPGASQGEKKYLPFGAAGIDEQALLNEIYGQLKDQNTIDVASLLGTSDDYYFRTDHHWNEKGAYLGYTAICQKVLNKQPNEFEYTQVSDSFYGTMYSRSGAFWNKPDSIYRIDGHDDLRLEIRYEDGSSSTSIYRDTRLDEKDKYTYYLDGNHPYVYIKTSVSNNKKAILIKDSFSHILLPYLIEEYEEIELFDLRYYHDSISTHLNPNGVSEEENEEETEEVEEDNSLEKDIDVYVIYGIETFSTDNSLNILW